MMAPAVSATPLASSAVAAGMEKPKGKADEEQIRTLTSGLAAGNEEAFREFHAAYFGRLLRYLFVATHGDEQAAHDAMQETMTRVVRYARCFDSEDAFWSWLTILARSAVADAGRKRSRYWRLIKNYALFRKDSVTARNDSDADECLIDLLREGLKQLQPVDRNLVEAKYLRRASVREIAKQFNLSERAVESRLLRARRQLRSKLMQRLKNETGI